MGIKVKNEKLFLIFGPDRQGFMLLSDVFHAEWLGYVPFVAWILDR